MMQQEYTLTISAWARAQLIPYFDARIEYTVGKQSRALDELLRALEDADLVE